MLARCGRAHTEILINIISFRLLGTAFFEERTAIFICAFISILVIFEKKKLPRCHTFIVIINIAIATQMDPVNTTTSALSEFLNRRLAEHTDILEFAYQKDRSTSTTTNNSNSGRQSDEVVNFFGRTCLARLD